MEALKISERELCLRKLMTSWLPAMNPPREPKLFEKVPIIRSTLSVRPKWLATPAPFFPNTPRPWASSIITEALYCSASSVSLGSGTRSPSME